MGSTRSGASNITSTTTRGRHLFWHGATRNLVIVCRVTYRTENGSTSKNTRRLITCWEYSAGPVINTPSVPTTNILAPLRTMEMVVDMLALRTGADFNKKNFWIC